MIRSAIPSSRATRRFGRAALLAAACGVIACCGCGYSSADGESTSDADAAARAALEKFWGPRALRILETADKLVIHRLATPEDVNDPTPRPLNQIKPFTGPVLAKPEQREELKRLLLDPKGYIWKLDKPDDECRDFPLIRLEFSRVNESVDVLLRCYCLYAVLYEDGKFVRKEDFDHNMPGVFKVIKQTFPQDLEIQALQ